MVLVVVEALFLRLIFLTAAIRFDYINFICNCIKKKDSDDQTAIGWFTKTHVKDLLL